MFCGRYLFCCFTVTLSVVPDDINPLPPAARRFTGNSLHVTGALCYVLSSAISKSRPDLCSRFVPACVSQCGFQNGM